MVREVLFFVLLFYLSCRSAELSSAVIALSMTADDSSAAYLPTYVETAKQKEGHLLPIYIPT